MGGECEGGRLAKERTENNGLEQAMEERQQRISTTSSTGVVPGLPRQLL